MSQAARILAALAAGLLLGIATAHAAWGPRAADLVEPVGQLWLNGLRMTIVPLVVGLLVTAIAEGAEAARGSRVAGRSFAWMVGLLWLSAILGAVLVPLLLGLFPMPGDAAQALKSALSTAKPIDTVPGFADFLRSIVPANVVSAAANDQILPLVVFATAFAFALTRISAEGRAQVVSLFRAVAEAMIVVVNWLLWIGPIGVFALAYTVGVRAGGGAFGALLHYIAIVSSVGIVVLALAYLVAALGARLPLARFAREVAPAQAVGFSTQSSLATLPAMLRSAEKLGVPVAASGVTLPLAVALFRATGPGMNMGVVLYVAHWYGMSLSPAVIAMGVVVAAITTFSAISLPGQVSFVTNTAPIALAMGVPLEPLALLIAVETIPDLFRTVGNVTMDVAVAATVARRGDISLESNTDQDRLLNEDNNQA
ncbi:MAG: dicarboxylate/amino acid:cation symporter [Alphaproteobacteria bacterium]|nr:dicarboxylate/amino acid:cation symporter [Alphaproteobacteria bacterium]